MRILVDADLPRSACAVIRQYGHDAIDVRDIGPADLPDQAVAAYAKEHGLCLMTGDFGFADIRHYPTAEYSGIVVFELPNTATAKTILNLIERFVQRDEILTRLPGRLAIVSLGRVRLRPA